MKVLKTVDEVIDALGGDTAVGQWLHLSQSAVGNWRLRREIPGTWQLRILARLRVKGLDCDPRLFGLSDDEARALGFALRSPKQKRSRSAAHV